MNCKGPTNVIKKVIHNYIFCIHLEARIRNEPIGQLSKS